MLINVFATWCGPCNFGMPFVVEAARDFETEGFAAIAINDCEPDDKVRAVCVFYRSERLSVLHAFFSMPSRPLHRRHPHRLRNTLAI